MGKRHVVPAVSMSEWLESKYDHGHMDDWRHWSQGTSSVLFSWSEERVKRLLGKPPYPKRAVESKWTEIAGEEEKPVADDDTTERFVIPTE